jgi:hypothetical protein
MDERRGRPKEIAQEPTLRKFTRVYEDDETIETWTFDLDKFERGPINVDIKYKNGLDKPKNWNKKAKEAKDQRRIGRQMKKINNKQNDGKSSKNNRR